MKSSQLRSYYPVFLNVNGRKCVVIGGGQVAWRKVKGLLECGAEVEVISPDLCPELSMLTENGQITLLRRSYQPGSLKGALVAVAATDDDNINREVTREARQEGILVNVVDDIQESDFIAPSRLQRGNITIAVSTSGSSPALARKIRAILEKFFGEEYAELAALVEEVRAELKRQHIKVNSEGWQQALDLDLLVDLLKKGKREKAKSTLLKNLKSL